MFYDFRGIHLMAIVLAFAGAGSAATLTVPTQHGTIAAALAAANSGDEIRVRHDHVESSHSNAISGKSLSIISYDTGYNSPQAGAQWVLASGGGGTGGGLILLQSSSALTFEGFSQIEVPGGNAFLVGASCSLTVSNCHFTGIVLSNTAGIKADAVTNVSVTVADCTFNANGRSIWYNNVTGTTALNVSGVTFTSNTSFPVEFRTMAGTHNFNMIDCSVAQATNSPTRLYFFGTSGGATSNNTVNIDRCRFVMTAPGSTPVILGGLTDASSPSSTANVTVTNCLIDLRAAASSANGIGCLADQPNRRSDITMRHCTVVQGNAAQSGIYQFSNTNPGTWAMLNSIVDGPGTALKNDGPGAMNSGKNLFNTAAGVTGGTGTASITLSGTEITGVAPGFVNPVGDNFRLGTASPALNVAVDLGVLVDLDGNERPIDGASDLGAYERQLEPAAAQSWESYY